jgi:SAM-dependent methyltransferase
MTDDMLALAGQNKAKLGLTNVEFRKGEIEALPVESNTVDVIISNCVINLSPDKAAVFAEAYRVLKPGGRFTVSDIVTEGEIPAPLRANLNAWAECLAGAIDQELYLEQLRQAGFTAVEVQSRTPYGPEALELLDETARKGLLDELDLSAIPTDFKIYSANIAAYK